MMAFSDSFYSAAFFIISIFISCSLAFILRVLRLSALMSMRGGGPTVRLAAAASLERVLVVTSDTGGCCCGGGGGVVLLFPFT